MSETLVISYARENRKLVNEFSKELNKCMRVWFDRHIEPATQDWWVKICEQIEQCFALVIFLSNDYIQSPYCMSELRYALALKKPIIPILENNCEIPNEIRQIQFIDLRHKDNLEDDLKEAERICAEVIPNIRHEKNYEGKYKVPSQPPKRPQLPGLTLPPQQRGIETKTGIEAKEHLSIAAFISADFDFVYDSAIMDDAWLKMIGPGRQPYLLVKSKEDETVVGWLTRGILSDRYPTILWREIGLSIEQHQQLVEEISQKSIIPFMVKWGALEIISANMALRDALARFIKTIYIEQQQLIIRAFPVVDEKNTVIGVLAYWHLMEECQRLDLIPDISVDECMLKIDSPYYIAVSQDINFRRAERLVDTAGWTSIAVTNENGELIGMISREKIKQITDERFDQIYDMDIKPHLRRTGLQSANSHDKLSRWIPTFIKDRQIDTIPVLEDGKLVGLLRHVDVLKAILDHLKD